MVGKVGGKKYLNNIPIQWPPTKYSFELLCKALNLKVTPTRIYDAIIYSRGPKMDEEPPEKFSYKKLIHWFLMNLKTIRHENVE